MYRLVLLDRFRENLIIPSYGGTFSIIASSLKPNYVDCVRDLITLMLQTVQPGQTI